MGYETCLLHDTIYCSEVSKQMVKSVLNPSPFVDRILQRLYKLTKVNRRYGKPLRVLCGLNVNIDD